MKGAMRLVLGIVLSFPLAEVFAAGGTHYVVLADVGTSAKTRGFLNKKFPGEEINRYWEKGYALPHINFDDNKWLVVMTKGASSPGQRYLSNPQNASELLEDGWSPVSSSFSTDGGSIGNTIVFNKVSSQSQKNKVYLRWGTYGHQGLSGLAGGFIYTTPLDEIVEDIWSGHREVAYLRTHSRGSADYITIAGFDDVRVAGRNVVQQVWAHRTEFPKDYMQNKRSEGYILQSLVYDSYENKWFTVMGKLSSPVQWTWLQYPKDADKMKQYLGDGWAITSIH